ncbi:MAG: phosphoribosylamine--glycine ligase, partial [Vicinamibacterales bacterium]
MNVLVVGAGAREHALAWTLARERGVGGVVVAPGNAGIARAPRL